MDLKNKKVMLVGLGILGGGVATAEWLCNKGAQLIITDLKDVRYLKDSINALGDYRIMYRLGEHKESDLEGVSLVVVNPDVPLDSPFINYVRSQNIPIENELTLFARECESDMQIAVTGTRGKTTTVAWIEYVLKISFPGACIAGNSPTNPFLKMVEVVKRGDPVVLETPSYQLELENKVFKPKIAVITNIYRDHINRHKSEEGYAQAKMNIFANQGTGDFLVLNADNPWTREIIQKDLLQTLWLVSAFDIAKSTDPDLSKCQNALFIRDGGIILRKDGKDSVAVLKEKVPIDFGEHMLMNFMIVLAVGSIVGVSIKELAQTIDSLPRVKFRQEKIFEGKIGSRVCSVFNDTTATSPDATIAAIQRFGTKAVYIIGGTNKELEFEKLALIMQEKISPQQVVLLGGSATTLLCKALKKYAVWDHEQTDVDTLIQYETLEECIVRSIEIFKKNGDSQGYDAIIFSPAAKSFEKFKNEYDRGVQFNDFFGSLMR